MIKRFFLSLALLAGLLTPAYPAGTISLSLSQQFDSLGRPLNAGKLYFIQAGTTSTPQNAYQDSALTIPHPNPLTLDSAGRVPQLFFADGQIKIRLTNAAGVNQVTADNILVVGASSGGGGGGSVDATTVLATGDVKARYGTGTLSGFVRLNGRTIGSATSGASERANADCQALFEYLWAADTTLTVSTGRGVTANADWVSNKTIALPDARGRALAGLNDMGNTNASVITPLTVTKGDTVTLGSLVGIGSPKTLLTANLPPYTPSVSIVDPGHVHGTRTVAITIGGAGPAHITGGGGTPTAVESATTGITAVGAAQGGTSTAFDTLSPLMLITLYQKL